MEIAKNNTKLSGKSLFAFQMSNFFKNIWLILLASVIIMLCAFRIKEGVFQLDSLWVLIIGAAIVPVYTIFCFISFVIQDKKFQPVDLEYTFYDDKIIVKGFTTTQLEQTVLRFEQISKVSQSKKYIFMYLNKTSALLINKGGFTLGDSNRVVSLLNMKLQARKELLKNNKKKTKI